MLLILQYSSFSWYVFSQERDCSSYLFWTSLMPALFCLSGRLKVWESCEVCCAGGFIPSSKGAHLSAPKIEVIWALQFWIGVVTCYCMLYAFCRCYLYSVGRPPVQWSLFWGRGTKPSSHLCFYGMWGMSCWVVFSVVLLPSGLCPSLFLSTIFTKFFALYVCERQCNKLLEAVVKFHMAGKVSGR